MHRVSLQTGVWTGSVGFIIGGAIAILTATNGQDNLAFVGWISILCGFLLAVWGVKIDGEHWWRKFFPAKRIKSPILIARDLYLWSHKVVDDAGRELPDLEAVQICLQVSNSLEDGKTLRNIAASLRCFIDKLPLSVLNEAKNLRHGEIEFVEVGTVVAKSKTGSSYAPVKASEPYVVDGVMAAYWQNDSHKSLRIGSEGKFAIGDQVSFYIVITADDVPAHSRRYITDFSSGNAYEWIRPASRGKK